MKSGKSRSKRPRAANGKRDYRAEYQARVVRGEAKGLTRSQSRGHSRANEAPVATKLKATEQDQRLSLAVRELRKRRSLHKAAKAAGVSPERLRRLLAASGIAEKRGRVWIIGNDVPRWMPLYTGGSLQQVKLKNRRAASTVARYMNAVGQVLESQNSAPLAPFRGRAITDARGKKHVFETDLNALYHLTEDGTDPFLELYKIG